jgi:hypothetical protein
LLNAVLIEKAFKQERGETDLCGGKLCEMGALQSLDSFASKGAGFSLGSLGDRAEISLQKGYFI